MPPRQCIVIGEQRTGKTALIERIVHKTFDEVYIPTVVRTCTKTFNNRGRDAKLTLIEVGGSIRSPDLLEKLYRDCDFVLLVFSVVGSSFEKIDSLLTHLSLIRPNMTKILVGTNGDSTERDVPFEKVKRFVCKNKINRYFEVSSKEGCNINELIHKVLLPILFDENAANDPHLSDASNFKLCIWGAPKSGKTAFRTSLCGGSQESPYFNVSRGIIKMCEKFWNVSIGEQNDGCEELREITLDCSNLLIIVFDINNIKSLLRILEYDIPKNFPTIVVGLKIDLYNPHDAKAITSEDIDKVIKATNALLYLQGNAHDHEDCSRVLEEALTTVIEWYQRL